jgi:tetratricopeptide (TPR) repeat protein
MLLYRNMKYTEAIGMAKKALSVDTYDPAANYYYGIINIKLGNTTDAKDGLDIAAMGMEYRSAAYTTLASLYLKEKNFEKAIQYARRSIDFNRYAIDAYQVLAISYSLKNDKQNANKILDTLLLYDPLNHFTGFEKYLWQSSAENKEQFIGLIKNEMPQETFLELAIWYHNIGRNEEADKILQLSPKNAEVLYWQAYLENKPLDIEHLNPDMVFPFRPETAEILERLMQHNDHWLLKYHLALIEWNNNNIPHAKELFTQCGDKPGYAPFYATRAELYRKEDSSKALNDLQRAVELDKTQWRYGQSLISYYLTQKQPEKSLSVAIQFHKQFPANYLIGMLYVKALMLNRQYSTANTILQNIKILPNEGATDGRQLYKETQLMLALEEMKKKDYKKALNYISAAKQWPVNLGVGKPYDSDVDERLEDWFAYESFRKSGNEKASRQMLNKILSFTSYLNDNKNIFSSANNLISAWALQKTEKSEQAEKFLQNWIDQNPANTLAQWAMGVYKEKYFELPDETTTDENYRVLKNFIGLFAGHL